MRVAYLGKEKVATVSFEFALSSGRWKTFFVIITKK